MQVAAGDRLAVIDPYEVSDLVPFWELLATPGRETLVHAGREEFRFCRRAINKRPAQWFDVQLAAGLIGLEFPASYGTLVNKLGTFIVPYLTLVLLRDFQMSEAEVALLVFAYGAGSVVSILAGGVLTDRLGRRRTLLVSLLGSGALAVVMGLLPSPRLFVPLLVAFGFIADLYRPAASALIGDLLPSSERATGFAGLRMAVNLGWASGTALTFETPAGAKMRAFARSMNQSVARMSQISSWYDGLVNGTWTASAATAPSTRRIEKFTFW